MEHPNGISIIQIFERDTDSFWKLELREFPRIFAGSVSDDKFFTFLNLHADFISVEIVHILAMW